MAITTVCREDQQHQELHRLPEERNDCGQLDGQGILEDQEGVHNRPEQGLALRLLHHQVPVLNTQDGAEHPQKIIEVQVPLRRGKLQGLLAQRGTVQRHQEVLHLA